MELCSKEQAAIRYYDITTDFLPEDVSLEEGEWLYLINYYGQLTNLQIKDYFQRYERVIVDNAQAYFQMPVPGVDTLYVFP